MVACDIFDQRTRQHEGAYDKGPHYTLLIMSRELLHKLYITISVTILVVVLAFSAVHREHGVQGVQPQLAMLHPAADCMCTGL